MDFAESDETRDIREMVHAFGEKEIAPRVAQWDRDEYFPREFNKRCAELGLLGGVLDERYGGSGISFLDMTIALEELGYFCSMARMVCGQPSFSLGRGLSLFGTEDQKEAYLRPTLEGDLVGATAVTESHSGSDVVRNMETTVTCDGEDYILNGAKVWVSNLENADWYLTFATIDRSRSYKGICAFVVEKSFAGVGTHPYHGKVGARTFVSGELVFDEVRVPAANLIGSEGEGYKVLLAGTESGRIACAAGAVGQLRRCLDLARSYALERSVMGQPIGEYQLVQEKIARMSTQLETARLLTYKSAWLTDQGQHRLQKETAAAKLYATDALMEAATDAMQIFGAYSCSEEYEIGRVWRDAKFAQIYDGANDIMTLVVGEHELGLRGHKRRSPDLASATPVAQTV